MSRKFVVPIVLPQDPTVPLEAATKQYVDNLVAGGGLTQAVADTLYVNVTGDTMTGSLVLPGGPNLDLNNSGPLTIGATNGFNLSLDADAIMARSAAAISKLFINQLGGDVQIGGGSATGATKFTLSGPFPTGVTQEWWMNGVRAMAMFPFGSVLPGDFVIQGQAAGCTNIVIQAPNFLQIDGNGKRSAAFRDGIATIGNDLDATGNSPSPIRSYGNSTGSYISLYHGTAPQTRSGYVGYTTATLCKLTAEVAGSTIQIQNVAGDVIGFLANGAERGRFDGASFLLFTTDNVAANNNPGIIFSGSNWVHITNAGANTPNYVANKTGAGIAAGHDYVHFRNNNTTIGSITRNGSTAAVLYNTTSDYRLKEDRGPITGALDRLRQLTPRRVTWTSDPTAQEMDGWMAHEVAVAVPEAVTGVKDAVATTDDEDAGLIEGEPIYQQLDSSRLTPLIVAAIKELDEKLTALTTTT